MHCIHRVFLHVYIADWPARSLGCIHWRCYWLFAHVHGRLEVSTLDQLVRALVAFVGRLALHDQILASLVLRSVQVWLPRRLVILCVYIVTDLINLALRNLALRILATPHCLISLRLVGVLKDWLRLAPFHLLSWNLLHFSVARLWIYFILSSPIIREFYDGHFLRYLVYLILLSVCLGSWLRLLESLTWGCTIAQSIYSLKRLVIEDGVWLILKSNRSCAVWTLLHRLSKLACDFLLYGHT